ncbi:PPPDE putative peptidase domain-containing protein [Radiomyces spectabilis]|uniref:PPPDE putative peptidase domain-containing protein n=1 Tax=Radiomyces spectabilis TaxID=64574 RepID=UPI00221E480C|nr:PPPDE putative peptidase domain-containing protein [Radiomyces spectabilis]KAI8371777.1 PPPDE putative peptidase domain-containing protein [Radiomyces spectabilis]
MFENLVNAIHSDSQYSNKHAVRVNVYDMLERSFVTQFGYYALGMGIFHSGLEVYGKEYCFGGHEYQDTTGVFVMDPKMVPPELTFKQSIHMGYTDLSEDELAQEVAIISQEFGGTSYNLLTRNCNHFTEEFCRRLTGKQIPAWINRAARLGALVPCVIPGEWIQPPEFEDEEDVASIMASAESYSSLRSIAPSRYSTNSNRRLHAPPYLSSVRAKDEDESDSDHYRSSSSDIPATHPLLNFQGINKHNNKDI